jgi:hypothetical protein
MDSLRMIAEIAEDEASSAKALEDHHRILELKIPFALFVIPAPSFNLPFNLLSHFCISLS